MNNEMVNFFGFRDTGALHRAIAVARALWQAKRWDGLTPIIINTPYTLHDRLFGVRHEPVESLRLDVDYFCNPVA